ncbi:MAG: hypothetical protein IKG27_02860 [Bacilli bacterium]|nr:hypothetical protein [Bacilli bacterium]
MTIKNIFKIHPFYFFAAFVSVITGHFKDFLLFSLIIVVHECGHVFLALIFKWNVYEIILLPFGALTVFNEKINRPLFEEFLILIFGPIFQIVFTFAFYNENIFNLSTSILFFNLLPVIPLDGSKVVNILLNRFLSFKKSHLITIYISFLTIFFVMIKAHFNLILMLIFIFILFKIIDEIKNHNNIFKKFLLERYIYDFNFKKIKFIKSLNLDNMKRDYRHIFYNGKEYVTERRIIKKMFDFPSKT